MAERPDGIAQLLYNQYSKGRGKAANWLKNVGQGLGNAEYGVQGGMNTPGDSDPGAFNLHAQTAGNLYTMLAPYMGSFGAQTAVRTGGLMNELAALGLQATKRRPLFNEQGFDVGDILANDRGMEPLIEKDKQRWGDANETLLSLLLRGTPRTP